MTCVQERSISSLSLVRVSGGFRNGHPKDYGYWIHGETTWSSTGYGTIG